MENAKPNIIPRRGMTPLERAWAAALCASGDAVANMGTDALRLAAAQKPQNVTSAGIMESTHKLARACRIIDVSTASTPAAQKAADAYALEAALYAVAYEAARLVRSDMWRLVAMRLDEAQEVGTRTSELHIRQPLGKLIMRRRPRFAAAYSSSSTRFWAVDPRTASGGRTGPTHWKPPWPAAA